MQADRRGGHCVAVSCVESFVGMVVGSGVGVIVGTLGVFVWVWRMWMRVGDTFPAKNILSMRIVEEAIQVNAAGLTVFRSDQTQYQVHGVNFLVTAIHNLNRGWCINKLLLNVVGAGISEKATDETRVQAGEEKKEKNSSSTPLRAEWLVVLMADEVRDRPNLTNEQMRGYLSPYAPSQYFTDNVLQNTRTKAKLAEFGEPSMNVQYAYHLQAAMDRGGHPCEMIFVNRGVVMNQISQILVDNENRRRYREGTVNMTSPERVSFLSDWFNRNKESIDKQMGIGPGHKYLLGILFTTSVGLTCVRHLQNVIQADGCHVNFGKYTIYSAYGSGADGTMFPVSFAILFGNETADGWGRFWEFTVRHYPFLNQSDVTVITDQDKGSINAINRHLPNACHFFCSWHRKGNVMKKCQGGKRFNSGYWFFNQMLQCYTLEGIAKCRADNENNVPDHALEYLSQVNDTAQYPASRCAMDENIIMYGRSASSGNESMNRANMRAHERHGVDLVVATMLLLKLASRRYENKKAIAWNEGWTSMLTRKGLEKCDECFVNVHLRNYRYDIQETVDRWVVTVSERVSNHDTAVQSIVQIMKEGGTHGSRFGTCTCGRPRVLGVPCHHMVIAVKSGMIPNLTKENVMPFWWMNAQFRLQYPQELNLEAGMDMTLLKSQGAPSPTIHYCPEIAGKKKTGRPTNNQRIAGVLETVGRGCGRGRGRGRGVEPGE
jgi:hypothetical protein